MAEFRAVCRAEDLVEDKGTAFEVNGLRIALFRVGEGVHAILARCPHANGPLDRGWVEDGEVVCPLHRWRFRLTDGRCSTVRGESVHAFRSEVRGGEVWVEV